MNIVGLEWKDEVDVHAKSVKLIVQNSNCGCQNFYGLATF